MFDKKMIKSQIRQCDVAINIIQKRKVHLTKKLQDACEHVWFAAYSHTATRKYFCKNCEIKFYHDVLKIKNNTDLLKSICESMKQRELIKLEKFFQNSIGKTIKYPFQRRCGKQPMAIRPSFFNLQTLEVVFDVGTHTNIEGCISICTDPERPYLDDRMIINPKYKEIFIRNIKNQQKLNLIFYTSLQ